MAEYIKRYNPNRSAEWNYGGNKWKLSRSKIELFLECPRCFYLDNKLGTKRPGFPSFNLNIAVDELFKKEFDQYRATQEPHPLMIKTGIDAIPYQHPELDDWRDPFVGVQFLHKETNMIISGGIDDVWEQSDKSLVVADYKSTSKPESINSLSDSPWEVQYRRQLGVYQWLFAKNGFTVAETGYFIYANALQTPDTFNDQLLFETTVLPCTGDTDWIEPTILDIKNCLESSDYPTTGENCEFCKYRQACGEKLQKIHAQRK